MADFQAKIQAILDPGKFDSQIKAILNQNYQVKLEFDKNFNQHLADLESKLKALQAIKINPFGPSGSSSGSNALNSALNPINLKNSAAAIANMQHTLRNLKFDNSAIDAITKNLDDMQIAVRNVRTEMAGKSVRITVTGLDDLQRTVTVVKQLDSATGTISTLRKTFQQSFGIEDMSGRITNSTKDFKELKNVLKEMGNLQVKVKGLDSNENVSRIAELNSQLINLQTQFKNLFNAANNNLTNSQMAELSNLKTQIDNRVAVVSAAIEDARRKTSEGIQYKIDTGEFSAAISSVEAQFNRLGSASQQTYSNIKSDLDELKRLQSDMANTSDIDTRIKSYEQFEKTLKTVNNSLAQIPAEEKKMATSLQAAQLKNEMSTWLSNNSKAAKNYGDSIGALIARVDQLNSSGQLTTEQARRIKEEFVNLKMEAAAAGEVGRSFGDSLSKAFKSITGVFDVTTVMRTAIRYMKQMAQEVIKVDTAMTQLKIVTNASASEYKAFYEDSIQTAKNIGASVSDLIDSATTYARLGYSLDESSSLAKYTGMLQNVGDIDVSSAQSAITAITKAFDIGVDQIELSMDKMVEVGNNFPISVSEIAEGMNNAGSMLASSGNSFEQSIALLTAANTTVQNISKSSTGLRTLAARIRNTKSELDDLGETLTNAEYESMVAALTGKGVSLKDANGEFRDTYSIVKDIAAVWDDMPSMDQAALAETLAGTRQQNVFFSLITNFKEAEKAMASMTNSSGTLTSSYEIYLDSVQGKINQFKVSWTELANTILSSDFLKFLVDGATTLLNVLDGIVGKLHTVPTLVGAIAAVASAKNGAGWTDQSVPHLDYTTEEYACEAL